MKFLFVYVTDHFVDDKPLAIYLVKGKEFMIVEVVHFHLHLGHGYRIRYPDSNDLVTERFAGILHGLPVLYPVEILIQGFVIGLPLYISKKEQLARFKKRLDDPERQWKISDSDYKERAYWGDYVKAFEDVLTKTSTEYAPWFIIPSNHKWFRDLAVSQIIVRQMEEMEIQLPKPTVNLAEIRREYHQAEDGDKARRS